MRLTQLIKEYKPAILTLKLENFDTKDTFLQGLSYDITDNGARIIGISNNNIYVKFEDEIYHTEAPIFVYAKSDFWNIVEGVAGGDGDEEIAPDKKVYSSLRISEKFIYGKDEELFKRFSQENLIVVNAKPLTPDEKDFFKEIQINII